MVTMMDVDTLTPVERHGDLWLKRDDLFTVPGADISGGKARACWLLSAGAKGLTTGCSRLSPQQQLVARTAKVLGVPCHVHTALGAFTEEMTDAQAWGAAIYQHYNGFSIVLSARSLVDAQKHGWTDIPFGMESELAVNCVRRQVQNIPREVRRVVTSLGSGIAAAGILWGLYDLGLNIPVLGVRVGGGSGSRIRRRLDRFAPLLWQKQLTIVPAAVPYEKAVRAEVDGVVVDAHYEAKAVPFLEPGDLFWIVGTRPTG